MESTSGEDAPKRNPLPSALVSNLQSVLAARRPSAAEVSTAATASEAEAEAQEAEASDAPAGDGTPARPIVLLTCAGGIRSAGLAALVDALVAAGRCDVHVCAPESYVLRLRKPNHSGTGARIGSNGDASKEWHAAGGAQIGSCTCSAAA